MGGWDGVQLPYYGPCGRTGPLAVVLKVRTDHSGLCLESIGKDVLSKSDTVCGAPCSDFCWCIAGLHFGIPCQG